MFQKYFGAILAILAIGCTLTSASVINRSAGNTRDVAHFFNECQSFSIGATFNGIPDGVNRALSAEGMCENAHKTVFCSYMWLNRCYNFNGGKELVPANGDGNFANYCRNCRTNDPLLVGWLFCDCSMEGTMEGSIFNVPVEANMQDHLYVNSYGPLSCPGQGGRLCSEDGSPSTRLAI